MPARALIIAIESYPAVTGGGLATTLAGTLQAGLDVERWLRAKWKADGIPDAETAVLFCSEPRQPLGRGATTDDIKQALLDLQQAGARATDELFVFFSGHGFAYSSPERGRADFLIAADFKNPALSAKCCLKLDGIVAWLRDQLGPGRHVYFIDACRNLLGPAQITPGEFDVPIQQVADDEPSTFVLQSTTPGAVAAVGSDFPATVLAGLGGRGEAKTYDAAIADEMVVHFGSLQAFVKATLPRQMVTGRTSGVDNAADAVLARIKPIPTVICSVTIADGHPNDTGTLLLKRGRGPVERRPLVGTRVSLPLEPDFYAVAVEINGASVSPEGFVKVALYDDKPVRFAKGPPTMMGRGLGAIPSLHAAPPVLPSMRHGEASLPAAGPAWAGDPAREAIAARFPRIDGRIDLSESLHGHEIEPDLDVWLAVIAAGAVLNGRPAGDFQKIAALSLHDFRSDASGSAPSYVLAGLAAGARLEVAVGRTIDDAPWVDAAAVSGTPGLFEAWRPDTPGQRFVSFRVDGGTPATVAVCGLADRATVFTLVIDEDGELQPTPFLIPIGVGIDRLAPSARAVVTRRPNLLLDVYQQAVAVRAFRSRRPLAKALDAGDTRDLRAGNWLDPLGPILVAYDLLRRGDPTAALAVADAISRVAPMLPDLAAIAVLAGRPRPVAGLPLVLDGLRALSGALLRQSMSMALLDERAAWTLCRGAVR
jgi:hypothetical protein